MTDLETFVNERFLEKWTESLPGLMLVHCVRKDAPDLPESVQSRIDVPKKARGPLAEECFRPRWSWAFLTQHGTDLLSKRHPVLRFRWPFYWEKSPPKGTKCRKCWDQGEYMVMRPGMFVPCDECNPELVAAYAVEMTVTNPGEIEFRYVEPATTKTQSGPEERVL